MNRLRLSFAIAFFAAIQAIAQTRSLDGVVKTAAGTPAAGMTVAITLMPTEDADDVTAMTVTGPDGTFHFAELKPGKYAVGAASATSCGGVTTADLTEASQKVEMTSAASCRVVSGKVTGGAGGAHVIAGRFAGGTTDIYAIDVRGGRYSIALPAGATVVVQAIAPDFVSVETLVQGTGDATTDLVAERRFKEAPQEVRRWIAANAIPLTTVEAGHGFDDMAPIKRLVGDARIVALGEATHGTRQFFQFKHRMLEYLVSKMGFNLFAIEASEPDAVAVDDYVVNGKGDPATALRNLGFWTWNTEEVLDMIRWMRKWNEDPAHTTKLRFCGFDMQSPEASLRKVRAWLTANLPDALPIIDRAVPLAKTPAKPLTADEQKEVTQAVADLAARLDAHTPHDDAWQAARHFTDLLRQAIPLATDSGARDRAMAENIQWIFGHELPNSRMVVWAHNGHVSTEEAPFSAGGTMGVHLRKMFGKQMVVIGFAFDHGSFRAVDRKKGLIEQKAASLEVTSFDRALATSGPPLFVLDLRPAKGKTREWLESALPMRSIGAVYDEAKPKNYVGRKHPLRSYDAIFFVNETTAAKGVRVPMSKPAAAAVNLSLDDGVKGWMFSTPKAYSATATTESCVSGGCIVLARIAAEGEAFGNVMQRIDATPYRGKKIRLRAKVQSTMKSDVGAARIWLRVDRADGIGFFDNLDRLALHSLPTWTDLEITGDVAPDAEAIAFGFLMDGDGVAKLDEVTLEVVP